MLDKIKSLNLRELVADDNRRRRLQFICTYIILGVVALIMSVVNIFTDKILLLASTAVFALLCGLNILLARSGEKGLRASTILFSVEFIILLTFFIVSGTPEGFSAIWAAMLPACGMLLFGKRNGTCLSAVMLLIMILLFWTGPGRSVLQYEYTQSFMLRFPMLYTAFLFMAFFLETVREATFENYEFQYLHDALTGALNRRGFSVDFAGIIKDRKTREIGFIIADIDDFKAVNDTYGHFTGDDVLKETAARLQRLTGRPVCRWGGEEFAVYFPGGIDKERAEKIVRDFAAEPIKTSKDEIIKTISVGAVTSAVTDYTSDDELCKKADECLYEAKNTGKNKAVFREL